MFQKNNQLIKNLNKEFKSVLKQEEKIGNSILNSKDNVLDSKIRSKIPQNVYTGLESAFCKGFSFVFNQGTVIIEKSFNKEKILEKYKNNNANISISGKRKDIKNVSKISKKNSNINLALTSTEGVALGAFGIGLPDIVLFISTLLKGIYETSLSFGFDYKSEKEKLFILKMIEASLSKNKDWFFLNGEVQRLFTQNESDIINNDIEEQIKNTARAFSENMLIIKFVQGMPIVGAVGGMANSIYYKKVMKYVLLMYKKRYILNKLQEIKN